MSQTFMRESLPVVARYFPSRLTQSEVIGAEGCARILTTGREPMFGVHIATSPFPWPVSMTPFILFYLMQVGAPLFVLASAMTWPIETSSHLRSPRWLPVTSKKWNGKKSMIKGSV